MEKYKNLDGLRGIAALVVVLCHYASAFVPSVNGEAAVRHFPHDRLIATTPLHLPFAGNFAVCIFFVLSGFVLSNKFFRTKDQDVIVSSAVRRYFRLMFPALVSVLLATLIIWLGFTFNIKTAGETGSLWLYSFWQFPAHLGQGIWEGVYGAFFTNSVIYNPTLWTMRYELYGSFLIFLFLSLFGKLEKRWIFYIVLSLVFLRSYYLAFIIGVALSDLWVNAHHIAERFTPRVSYALLAVGLFLGSWYTPTLYPSMYNHIPIALFNEESLVHTLGALAVIIAVLRLASVSRLFELRPVQYLGKISFSLYLVHFIILGSLGSLTFGLLLPKIGYTLSFLATFSSTIVFTFGVAHYYNKFVDEPSIKLSRVIGNFLLSSRSAASTKVPLENKPPVFQLPGLVFSQFKTFAASMKATSLVAYFRNISWRQAE